MFEIARILEKYDTIFYKIWDMGKPIMDKSIPTACVGFDKKGNFIAFRFNPDFYNELSTYEKAFVVAHESLHIILNHGKRLQPNAFIDNIAKDIAIHEIMFNIFDFKLNLLQHKVFKDFCTREICEKKFKVTLKPNETAEYYYKKLEKLIPTSEIYMIGEYDQSINNIPNSVSVSLSEDEFNSLKQKLDESSEYGIDGQEAGKGTTCETLQITIKVVKKNKWEKIIKDRVLKLEQLYTEQQWFVKNPRLVNFDGFLPFDKLKPIEHKDKIDLFFFQDTSGSCAGLAERFLKAAKSIPEDKFNIRFYCFDTEIYKSDLKTGQLYGFGGTSFYIIENEIQRVIMEEKRPYPQSVFVVTDGFGDSVNPAKPERWCWLLSEWNTKEFIPSSSKSYNLSEFE